MGSGRMSCSGRPRKRKRIVELGSVAWEEFFNSESLWGIRKKNSTLFRLKLKSFSGDTRKHEERKGSSRFLANFRNDDKEIPNQVLSLQRDKGINASSPLQRPKTFFVITPTS
ncbi:hypothetical protein CEXT_292641 [Caerostris extrusa]|uniref:Uncharacterized protein n=1 Tax=Caerostris extrusa TaxID=172846 RepID=A0AAV4W7G5_CAEEX|nr:hypothetical protein CEXT_292641 [Caerostris extrusa]